ncbi:hypothetical protein BSR00_17715 [Serratia liquefaciens]|nr:hypothetical protein BSR00_17715 [Serratia liquefaciens]RYM75753.1 hypothetical protein BSR01_23370 [Serratia liquefaciens]
MAAAKDKMKCQGERGSRGEKPAAMRRTKASAQRPGWSTFSSLGDRDHIIVIMRILLTAYDRGKACALLNRPLVRPGVLPYTCAQIAVPCRYVSVNVNQRIMPCRID